MSRTKTLVAGVGAVYFDVLFDLVRSVVLSYPARRCAPAGPLQAAGTLAQNRRKPRNRETILVLEDVQRGSLPDEQSHQSLRSAMRRTLGSIVGRSEETGVIAHRAGFLFA